MTTELIRQLLEAGVHFGHKTSNWNPRMAKFIFGERANIHVIDLEKTAECLNKAIDFLKNISSQGEVVLFVGTKKQAQEIIKSEAERCSSPYVNSRWIGGLLTNFSCIKRSIDKLKELEEMREKGVFGNLSKKESSRLNRELERLLKNFSGVKEMQQLPKALFIIDPKKERTVICEAKRLSIPIVSLIDTNCDPDAIDFPIPGNDDAIKSIKIIAKIIADSILEGREVFLSYLKEEPKIEVGASVTPIEKLEVQPEVIEEIVEKKEETPPTPKTKQKRPKEKGE